MELPWLDGSGVGRRLYRGSTLKTWAGGLCAAPDAVVAVEVRDPLWLTPEFVAVLRDCGATYCLRLHAKNAAD